MGIMKVKSFYYCFSFHSKGSSSTQSIRLLSLSSAITCSGTSKRQLPITYQQVCMWSILQYRYVCVCVGDLQYRSFVMPVVQLIHTVCRVHVYMYMLTVPVNQYCHVLCLYTARYSNNA